MRNLVLISGIVFLGIGYSQAGTWTTLDYSGSEAGTTNAWGISGSNIVGMVGSSSFIYDMTAQNWTMLSDPAKNDIVVHGISGNTVIGRFGSLSSFTYDITTQNWTTLNYPGAEGDGTSVWGISGSNIVGSRINRQGSHGFLYNGTDWIPLALSQPIAIDGSDIVGLNEVYNITSGKVTILNYPGATDTDLFGISGGNIIGNHQDSSLSYHAFLYNGSSYTALNYPGAIRTEAHGIGGNNIVGQYWDSSNYAHSFIYTIPEPATLMLLGFGGLLLKRRRG